MDLSHKNNKLPITIPKGTKKTIIKAIKELQSAQCVPYLFPEELKRDPIIIAAERAIGIRQILSKGYDVLTLQFFVNESLATGGLGGIIRNTNTTSHFTTFKDFFNYLQGDIYENACYYGYVFSPNEISELNIDLNKINQNSLINYTIDDFTIAPSKTETQEYAEGEQTKKRIIAWMKKFNDCDSYEKFIELQKHIDHSPFAKKYKNCLIYGFMDKHPETAFNIIMNYVNGHPASPLEECLCLFYDPNTVLNAYNNTLYSKSTASEYKKALELFISGLIQHPEQLRTSIYFDKDTHLYTHKVFTRFSFSEIAFYRYFDSLESLAAFLNNDLSNVDLSNLITNKFDTTIYKSNQNTKWPVAYYNELKYTILKEFDHTNNQFIVTQKWIDENNNTIKRYNHTFKYYFDFIHFLKNDLSYANLLFCDNLINIPNFNGVDLSHAQIRSGMMLKFGIDFERITLPTCEENPIANENEIVSSDYFISSRPNYIFEEEIKHQKIYYISDLHLLHRLHNASCINACDIDYTIQCIIDKITLVNDIAYPPVVLIGGDVSSNFNLYKFFITRLRKTIRRNQIKADFVFILGNHELWSFPDKPLVDIVAIYRNLITENGMYLLHNSIIYKSEGKINEISEEQLNTIKNNELFEKVKQARIIVFGGTAFAGKNDEFNANIRIYRDTINRTEEIAESIKFESLYKKICDYLPNKKVIVFTHMPKKDWANDDVLQKGYVYVSGHSHKNYFYDDGDYRIYADNQIGYHTNSFGLKSFYIENDYDIFERYTDGIYKISKGEYIDFYRGKNITMSFNRDACTLYMLKKKGFYMFILQYPTGSLCILNGGAIKKLPVKQLNHYYNNMDNVIATIKNPLDKFTAYQIQIASAIKSLGGSGTIHGAIIDIDFYNHVYVNPLDLSITPYWASDIINKTVYPSIPALLEANCPKLFLEYKQKNKDSEQKQLILKANSSTSKKQLYTDTDIYTASREIKKMQKLGSNILSIWIEPDSKRPKLK